MFDDQNRAVRFANLDPVLPGMRIKMNLGKNLRSDRNKRDIDIIHIGLYHLENGILDIAMSFQFIHLWIDLMT
jgi:hypothetical protein